MPIHKSQYPHICNKVLNKKKENNKSRKMPRSAHISIIKSY